MAFQMQHRSLGSPADRSAVARGREALAFLVSSSSPAGTGRHVPSAFNMCWDGGVGGGRWAKSHGVSFWPHQVLV